MTFVQAHQIGVVYNADRDNLVSKCEELLVNYKKFRKSAENASSVAKWENNEDTYLKVFFND